MIGMPIKYGDVISIQYEASYEDGTTFDSTEKNGGEPLKFQLGTGQIIRGFEEQLLGMEVGEEKNFLSFSGTPDSNTLERLQRKLRIESKRPTSSMMMMEIL